MTLEAVSTALFKERRRRSRKRPAQTSAAV